MRNHFPAKMTIFQSPGTFRTAGMPTLERHIYPILHANRAELGVLLICDVHFIFKWKRW